MHRLRTIPVLRPCCEPCCADTVTVLRQVASLENEVLFLQINVAPLWGGRVYQAIDKKTGRHLVNRIAVCPPLPDRVAGLWTYPASLIPRTSVL